MNTWLAVKITNFVGSMWCAYLFALMAIYGFPYSAIHSATVIQWVSQEFLQLVLLSVIMVGQNVHAQEIADVHVSIKKIHHHIGLTHESHSSNPE